MAVQFHRAVWFPDWLKLPGGTAPLEYSRHALEEAEFDRLGDLTALLPTVFDFDAVPPVEVTADARLRFERGLYRVPATKSYDLCLVLCRPEAGRARVASVWANSVTDHHRSLRKERYVPPPVAVT